MSWHSGYPLSQTVFTSVYIESLLEPEPRNLDQARFVRKRSAQDEPDVLLAALRAFCLGLIRTCGFVLDQIVEEHYYEVRDDLASFSHTL